MKSLIHMVLPFYFIACVVVMCITVALLWTRPRSKYMYRLFLISSASVALLMLLMLYVSM